MWRCLILLFIVAVCLASFLPLPVYADTTATVTIYAQGLVYFPNAPSGFTVIYISDYEIGLLWGKAATANMTLIRAAYGREVIDRNDGFEVYYGTGNYTTHWIPDVGMVGPIYYKAWSQDVGGNWSTLYAEEDAAFMSSSFLFIGLIGLAGMLTYFSWKRRHMLIVISGALVWLALGFWLLLGDVSNLNLADPWTIMLAWVFIVMAVACFLFLMDVEITREARGRRYTEWGPKPPEERISNYEKYRAELRRRTRGR